MTQSSGLFRFRSFALVLSILCLTLPGMAASPKIRKSIDESSLVALKGNVHPSTRVTSDQGAVSPSLPAKRMLLVLKRGAGQEADLQQYLGQLHDKNSANYQKWLTPAQLGERFGAAPADVQTLNTWLTAHGFTVNQVNAARTTIEFSGTAGQVEQTFHTSLHQFESEAKAYIANVSDPQIPEALAPAIAGIVGLNDFPIASAAHSQPVRAAYDKATHLARPETTTTAGGKLLYVGPNDAATIYDTPNSYNAKFSGSASYTGNGVTIGVISDANINTADVDSYRSFFGLPASTPTVIVDGNAPGVDTVTTGDTQRALTALEIAGAMAPGAKLVLYTAKDALFDQPFSNGILLAVARAVSDNSVDILQVGFNSCEASLTIGVNQLLHDNWEVAAAEGMTVVAAAGDSGSGDCDVATTSTAASGGLGVNGFASTPFNIAVGGTDFDTLPADFSTYVGSNGIALSYIPELPWNNSVALGQNGALDANTPFTNSAGATNIFAGGGGASSCVNGAGCPANGGTAGYGKPSWQTGSTTLNIPTTDGVRDLPDVSMLAGTGQYGAAWAVCGNDYDSAGTAVADCTAGSGAAAQIQGIGGTNAAAAAFSGILALVSQSQGKRLGQANFVLYNLANQAALYNTVFHDLKTGNNSVVCSAGSTDCGSNGFLTGYNAGTAYDQASGLGSVDASALITDWKKAVYAASTTTLTVSDPNGNTAGAGGHITVTHGQNLTFNVGVAGSSGTPTGEVAVLSNADEATNGVMYGDDVALALTLDGSGHANVSGINEAPGGTYQVRASYDGSLTYAQSTSPTVTLTIDKEDSALTLALWERNAAGVTQTGFPSNPSFPYGTYVAIAGRAIGVSAIPNEATGTARGTVTFVDNGVTLPTPVNHTNNINNIGVAETPIYGWPLGPHAVTASYGGDSSFNPTTQTTPVTFTIGQAATTMTLTANPTSLISGTTTLTGTITTTGYGTAPSGTVTLTDTTNGAALGTPTLVAGKNASGFSISTFTVTVNATTLSLGANTITATYGGDTNYTGSTANATVTRLAKLATTLTMVATPPSLISGTTIITGTVTAANTTAGTAPTGTITLTDTTNGVALGTATLVASGTTRATFTITVDASKLTLGANTLTAVYAGDANYTTSTGTVVVTLLAKVTTSVTMTANPTSLFSGSTTITGVVTAAGTAAGTGPTGSIRLTDSTNGTALGSANLVAASSTTATFTFTVNVSSLTIGANTLTGVYGGDGNYVGSPGTVVVTRQAAPPANYDFTISATSVTIVNPGEKTGNTSTITVTPEHGFTGQVNLTATLNTAPDGAVSLPTISLASPSVNLTGAAAVTDIATINTTALTYAMDRAPETPHNRWYPVGGAALAGVLLLGIPARRRGWKAMLALLLFSVVGLSVGCGVTINAVKTTATTPGTYVFTVNGVDQATGVVTGSGTLTVTVDPMKVK